MKSIQSSDGARLNCKLSVFRDWSVSVFVYISMATLLANQELTCWKPLKNYLRIICQSNVLNVIWFSIKTCKDISQLNPVSASEFQQAGSGCFFRLRPIQMVVRSIKHNLFGSKCLEKISCKTFLVEI